MNIWWMGDMHGAHDNIVKYRSEFQTEPEMWDTLKTNYHKRVKKRDKVIFLGDTAFSIERLKDLKTWVGASKVLILGNHDTERLNIKDIVETGCFDEIHGMLKYKEFWLSHAPIHPSELRGRFSLHGHTHKTVVDDPRYINVCPEVTNYSPISLHEVRQEIIRRKEKYGEDFSLFKPQT